MNTELSDKANPASQLSPGIPRLPILHAGITGGLPHLPGTDMGGEGLDSGPFHRLESVFTC